MANELRTERLLLRRWKRSDREPFAALNADPRVMEHFPGCLSEVQSRALILGFEEHFDEHGFGLWAVEVPGVADCIGFTGLKVVGFEARFTPAVEIAWRLAAAHWGRGYASEAARAVLDLAFGPLGLDQVVSFTVPANVRSIAVMERLGMQRDGGGTFEHPALPVGHPLRPHVLYRIARDARAAR